jgi:hemerythrin-like metal-binding protein
MLISWNDHFIVGIDAVDSGHALVIDTINRLNEGATPELRAQVVADRLPRLREQLTAQFAVEDGLLRGFDAQRRAHHDAEHARLLGALDTVAEHQAAQGNAASVLLFSLVCFLVSHLRGTDGDDFRAKAARGRAA